MTTRDSPVLKLVKREFELTEKTDSRTGYSPFASPRDNLIFPNTEEFNVADRQFARQETFSEFSIILNNYSRRYNLHTALQCRVFCTPGGDGLEYLLFMVVPRK